MPGWASVNIYIRHVPTEQSRNDLSKWTVYGWRDGEIGRKYGNAGEQRKLDRLINPADISSNTSAV